MSIAPHLTLVTELMPVTRRSFDLAVPAILNPLNANPLLDGEWMELNSSYKLVRGSGEAAKPCWQVINERGRYDVQGIQKTDVLFLHGYEAETDIWTSTSVVVGSPLIVTDCTIGGLTKRGLAFGGTGTAHHMIFGWCTRLIGSGSTAKVRYWCPNAPQTIYVP